jgi:hypothetical protein
MTLDWSIAIYIIELVLYSDRHNGEVVQRQITLNSYQHPLFRPH